MFGLNDEEGETALWKGNGSQRGLIGHKKYLIVYKFFLDSDWLLSEIFPICLIWWWIFIFSYFLVFYIVCSSEYEAKLEEFTELEMSINGTNQRTSKGYAVKDVAVWWLFESFKDMMESKGYTWEHYVEVFANN